MKYKWRAHTAKKEKRLSLYRSNLIIAHSNTVKKKKNLEVQIPEKIFESW